MAHSFGLSLRRWWHRRGLADSPLRDVFNAPLPALGDPVTKARFVAVDLELTGLDPQSDQIVSMGWVPVENERVRLQHAQRHYVEISGSVAESATVHGIVDNTLNEAIPLQEALAALLETLPTSILIAHHAPVETRFLNAACQRLYGAPLLIPVVDTVALGRRLMERGSRSASDHTLRLPALRQHFGLPAYPAHDALTDAVATAELFLAQCAHLRGGGTLHVRTVLRG